MGTPSLLQLASWAVLLAGVHGQSPVHVSPDGRGEQPGTAELPTDFATAMRRLAKPTSKGTSPQILVHGGRYEFAAGFVLGEGVRGTADAPIRIDAVPGEHVVFDGSVAIDAAKFKPVSAADRGRMAANAVDHVVVQTLEDAALIEHFSNTLVLSIDFDGVSCFPARFPNEGYAQLAEQAVINEPTPPAVPIGKEAYGVRAGHPPYQEDGREQGWLGSLDSPRGAHARIAEGGDQMAGTWAQWERELKDSNRRNVLTGYLDANWLQKSQAIVSADAATQSIHLSQALAYGWAWKNNDKPFHVFGLLCELDAPGEWYFDPRTRQLFLYPRGELGDDTSIRVPVADGFMHFRGAHHVHVTGLNVENVAAGTIYHLDGHGNLVGGARVANSTACAVRLTGTAERVTGCDFVDVYSHIALGGGSRGPNSIEPGGNVAENCHCYQKRFSHRRVSISVRGVGNTLRNNLIHNSLGQAVTIHGNDHLLERNELFQIGYDEGDGGAMYAGADLSGYGVIYRHNFFHHLMHVPGKVERSGIFLDDMQAGATCVGNLFFKAAAKGIFMNGGAGHTLRDNVFLEGYRGIYNVGHGARKTYDRQVAILADPAHDYRNTKENYVGRVERVVGPGGWRNEPWKTRYPLFFQVMEDTGEFGRLWPIRCEVRGNLFANNARGDRTLWSRVAPEALGKTLIESDRKISPDVFVDYDRLDLRFRKGVEGLPAIPFASIGLRLDPHRKTMPDKAHYRTRVREFYRDERSMPGTRRRLDTAELVESGPILRRNDAAK